MKKFKKILFPVDFSEVPPEIVPYVISMADKLNAEVHIIFVVRRLENCRSIFVSHVAVENFEMEIVLGAETKMDEFVEKFFKSVISPKTKVLIGDIVEEIIQYIKAKGIDLVIIGTHGRKGMDRIILGSIADRVIKSAPVPVLSVNPYISLENKTDMASSKA
ncbi:MAG: universal stress protein [Desulfobulbaceae bacterium]|nr:universal stress protein [Desulfobulbaceae bacterium]